MKKSAHLPLTFGRANEGKNSSIDGARVVILPVSREVKDLPETAKNRGILEIIDASTEIELYDEETDSEVYRIGISVLDNLRWTFGRKGHFDDLFQRSKDLISTGKFVCLIADDHAFSAPVIQAHAETYHNLSVLQLDAYPDLKTTNEDHGYSSESVMTRIIRGLGIPSVQAGIRSMSADEARLLDEDLPTKIFWARDMVGNTKWIDEAFESLTDNVYLTIDLSAFDPTLQLSQRSLEPGGLGWFEVLNLIHKLADKKKVVGMDLVEFSKSGSSDAPAFLCAKLIYKSLAYIFQDESPKCRNS